MPTLANLPLLQIISDEEDEEEDEKEASEGSDEGKGDDSSSSSEGSSSDGTNDDGGDEDEDARDDDTMICCDVDSMELWLVGSGAGKDREVDSRADDVGAIPLRRCILIMREGHDVPTDEDENESFARKRPLGVASHGSLGYFANTYGANEPDIELFISPNLRGCRLVGTDEERWFMASVYHQI